MGQRVKGQAFLKIDGNPVTLGDNLTVSPQGRVREGVTGLSGNVGYGERPRIPYIEADAITTPGFKVSDLEGVQDATIVAELANGRVYTARNAWFADETDVSAGDGTAGIRFEALRIDEK